MITLYVFGNAFGLADPSPFVVKAHGLLRMAGIAYNTELANFKKAPKGKFPVVNDNGKIVPDSTLIRFHLETAHGIDFDSGMSESERGAAWAFEKLCEDQLYWAIVDERWMNDTNFEKGPRHFFDSAPAIIRPLIVAIIRRKVRKNLHAQGWGRFTREEKRLIAGRAMAALASYLKDREFLGGAQPCGADASVYATISGFLTEFFQSDIRQEVLKHPVLVEYANRMKARYFSEIT